MKKLSADDVVLKKVFSSDFELEVPVYQRPYRWGTDQALQLLNDLDEWASLAAGDPYFLGSIVLVHTEGNHYHLIDGQQRATTLTLLLAALRDLATDDQFRRELDEYVREPGKVTQGLQPRPRLVPAKGNVSFFEDHIHTVGGILGLGTSTAAVNDGQRALRDNAIAIRDELATWDEARRNVLVTSLVTNTFLVVVTTEDLESAHRIFSVMNSRGLDLTAPDIVKADLIGLIADDKQEVFAQKWDAAEQSLGTGGFEDLFAHIRMLFMRVQQRQGLLKELEKNVLPTVVGDSGARDFINRWVAHHAALLSQIRSRELVSDSPGAKKVDVWFERLAQIDNFDWEPVALWILDRHHDDIAAMTGLLERLERLAASMMVRREIAARRIQRYGQLLGELESGQGEHSPAFELSQAEKSRTLEALNGPIYLLTRVRKYVLLRLDEALSGAGGAVYDHKIVSIEHVLPQGPPADSQWLALFDEDQRELWTHRLANLVLLNRIKNSEAQNFDFERKKEKYFSAKNGVTTFAITTQVMNKEKWSPGYLDERQADLVGRLATIWDLDG